jgi:guanylate kinase
MENGRLVIISAPSGAGKTTIVRHLLESGLRLEFSVSATTRPIRGNEQNGREYYFLSVDEFRKKTIRDEFVEWEEVYHDHFYGTLKSELERIWKNGNHVLFDVDVKGGVNLKRIFGEKAISLFIMPPSTEELERRLLARGTDNPDKIKMRIMKASEEMKAAGRFDHIVVNDIVEKAQSEAYDLVSRFLNRKSDD